MEEFGAEKNLDNYYNDDYLSKIFEEVEGMLQSEDLYTDNDDLLAANREQNSLTGLMKTLSPEISILILCIIFLILTPLMTIGVTRHIYMTKLVMLFIASMFSVLPEVISFFNGAPSQKYETKYNFDKARLEIKVQNKAELKRHEQDYKSSLTVFSTLSHLFANLDEVTSLVLIRELYKCLVKMKKREYKLLSFMKMQAVFVIIVTLLSSLQKLDLIIQDPWWKWWNLQAVPINSMVSLLIFSSVLYHGIHALLSLRNSDQFQNGNSTTGAYKKHQHLVFLIYVLILALFLKFFSRILNVVFGTLGINNSDHCNTKFKEITNVYDFRDCFTSTAGVDWSRYCYCFSGILEIATVHCIFIHKKCRMRA